MQHSFLNQQNWEVRDTFITEDVVLDLLINVARDYRWRSLSITATTSGRGWSI